MLKIYVGIEWYDDDLEPRINGVVTFLDEDKAKEWVWYAPRQREIKETELQ